MIDGKYINILKKIKINFRYFKEDKKKIKNY